MFIVMRIRVVAEKLFTRFNVPAGIKAPSPILHVFVQVGWSIGSVVFIATFVLILARTKDANEPLSWYRCPIIQESDFIKIQADCHNVIVVQVIDKSPCHHILRTLEAAPGERIAFVFPSQTVRIDIPRRTFVSE
jgi:hypothetical protein